MHITEKFTDKLGKQISFTGNFLTTLRLRDWQKRREICQEEIQQSVRSRRPWIAQEPIGTRALPVLGRKHHHLEHRVLQKVRMEECILQNGDMV